MAKAKNKTGRPLKPFSWEDLETFCQYRLALSDIADLMKVSEDTVQQKINKKFGISFSAYRNKKLSVTRAKLAEKAISMALAGNVPMLIFSLKNLCDWVDRVETSGALSLSAPSTINKISSNGPTGELVKLGVVSN